MKKVVMVSLLLCAHNLLSMRKEEKELLVKTISTHNAACTDEKEKKKKIISSSDNMYVQNNTIPDSLGQRCSVSTLPVALTHEAERKFFLLSSQNSGNDAGYISLNKQEDNKEKKKNIIDKVKDQARLEVFALERV